MAYVINVESRADGRLAPPERRTVHTSRMTIGRGAECSVRLDDAKKHVSRVHAVVDLQGEGHVLTVMSTVNPVLLNGARVGPGESVPIRAEDTIEIGDFSVQLVELHAAKATPGASSARQVAASPFDFGLAGGGDTVPGEDPFKGLDDLLPAKPRPAAAPEPMPDPFAFAPGKPAARPSEGLVDGLGAVSHLDLGQPNESTDPLMGLLSSSPGRSPGFDGPTFNPQPFAASAASLDQILGRGPTKPIGQPLADLAQHHAGGSSNIDHVQPINMAFRPQPIATPAARSAPPPPPVSAPSSSPDPFDGFDPFASLIHPKSPPPARVEPEPAPEAAPAPVRVEPALAPAGKSTEAASPLATSAALVAFLEGAGLAHLELSEADAEAFLRESGTIVRASVEGLIGLLLARSELKKEMRAEDRTMVASRDNNPLKLMTDPQEAMGYLFDKRERLSGAFLPPVQAVHDACDDLRVHEIALMAGMRAAFQGALKRFEPQLIEREADKQKGAFSLNKKVKLWDAFVAHHEKLSRDAEDDLLKVFGREFLGTYMAQVRRLRSGPRK
jgi:type VI secretion system FHA domain protein